MLPEIELIPDVTILQFILLELALGPDSKGILLKSSLHATVLIFRTELDGLKTNAEYSFAYLGQDGLTGFTFV